MATDPKQIKAIGFDIDGVLSDGRLVPMADGDVLRILDAKDSFAVRAVSGKGLVCCIIAGGNTVALRKRCISMKVPEDNVYLGARGKLPLFLDFCKRNSLDPSEVAYMGDDIADIPVLRACGLGMVPCDGVPEAKAVADFISSKPGGHGAAREGVELILKAQGKWVFEEDSYDKIY